MKNMQLLIPGGRTRQTKRWAYFPFFLFGSAARDFLLGDKMEKSSFKRLKSRLAWSDRLRRYTEEKNKLSRQGVHLTDEVLQRIKDKWRV